MIIRLMEMHMSLLTEILLQKRTVHLVMKPGINKLHVDWTDVECRNRNRWMTSSIPFYLIFGTKGEKAYSAGN